MISRRLFILAAALASGLCAFCAGASAQVRVQGIETRVPVPISGASLGIPPALAPSVAAPSITAAPSLVAVPAISAAVPAAAAASADGPAAERPSAAASARAAAAPTQEGTSPGRVAFDGAVSDPRRAVQLETVNRFWDESNLAVTRLPIVVGEVSDKTAFSQALRQNPRVQMMMIRKPGGGLRLPEGLKQFRAALAAMVAYEKKINPEFDRSYAYLTVTQGLVEPGQSHKRPNAHTDGYPRRVEDRGEVDRMYLVSDVLPTEFFDQPFPVPTAHDFAAIHATFENAADPSKVVVHPDYTITMMDSYTVHRSRKAGKPEFRTFVQVHFASRRYEMAQNTPNPLFTGIGNNAALEKIKVYWREYETRYRAAAVNGPIVENPRSFFAETVDLGKLWWAKTVWGNRMSLDAVEWAARRVVRGRFEPKAPGSARAFDAFAARVRSDDNPESPYSKRKRFSHALLDASLLRSGEVAFYFDGLLRGETRRAESEYRRTRVPEIVSSFREEANAILTAKLAANKDYNVAGVLVAGSYAYGSARASSDFDLVVLTRDGTGRDVADFMAELEKRRDARGWADWKDWRRYPVQNIFGASDERTLRFVRELPAIIVTPDAALLRRLSAEAMSRPIWDASPLETLIYRLAAPFRRWYLRRELDRVPDAPFTAEELSRSFLLDNAAWSQFKKRGSLPSEWIAVNDSLRSKIRTGWTKRGIPAEIGESVWEHSLKVREAVLLYAANHPEIDAHKAGLMALFHDVTEYRAPDYTPGDVSAEDKNRIEGAALDYLAAQLGPEGSRIKDLWKEYEEGQTPEAILVKQLDKFDPAVQAIRYERLGYPVQDFYPYTRARLTDPVLVSVFETLMQGRSSGIDPYRQYFEALGRDGRQIPRELENIYQELPGRAIRRLADDPVVDALREAEVQLWTIRHGESESNRAGLLTGSGTNAPLTSQLNAKGLSGELQARTAASRMYENLGGDRWAREVLSGAGKPVVILFSPLLRAEGTAKALITLLDEKRKELGGVGPNLYEAHAVADLREMSYGDLDGTTLIEAKKLPWWPAWDGITGAGRDFFGRFPGGESRFDVLLRQRGVLLWIAKRFRGRKVITFAHFETVIAQKAVFGQLTVDAGDQALRVTPVENAQPHVLVGLRR